MRVQIGDSVSPSCSSIAAAGTIVQELYTVLPAYLVPRHQLFPTLNTHLKVTPSYAEAPREGTITIAYSYISSLRELDAWSAAGGRAVVRAATALIRDQVTAFGGYEVREMSGNFLLAFRSPDDALRFCISTQHALMRVRSCSRCCAVHMAGRAPAVPAGCPPALCPSIDSVVCDVSPGDVPLMPRGQPGLCADCLCVCRQCCAVLSHFGVGHVLVCQSSGRCSEARLWGSGQGREQQP